MKARPSHWLVRTCATCSGQHGVDAYDETGELGHELTEEARRGVVGHLAVVGDEAWLKLDVGLDGVHEGRVAERQDAAQVLLRDGGADLARGRPERSSGVEVASTRRASFTTS